MESNESDGAQGNLRGAAFAGTWVLLGIGDRRMHAKAAFFEFLLAGIVNVILIAAFVKEQTA